MTFKKILIFHLILLCLAATKLYGQTDADRVKSAYNESLVALKDQNYSTALSKIESAQKYAGRNLAAFELIKVRIFYSQNDLAKAQRSVQVFNQLGPTSRQRKEIGPYIESINYDIQQSQNRFARLFEQEKIRLAEEEKKRLAYEARLKTINVEQEAFDLGQKIRRATLLNTSNTNYYPRSSFSESVRSKAGVQSSKGYKTSRVNVKINPGGLIIDNRSFRGGNSTEISNWALSLQIVTYVNASFERCQNVLQEYLKTQYKWYISEIIEGEGEYSETILKMAYENDSFGSYLPSFSFFWTGEDKCSVYFSPASRDVENADKYLNQNILEAHNTYSIRLMKDLPTQFTFTESQMLAFRKDSNLFQEYLIGSLFRKKSISFSALDREIKERKALAAQREAERLAREQLIKENEIKADQLEANAEKAVIDKKYDEALSTYKELYKVLQFLNRDTKVLEATYTRVWHERKEYYQNQYNSVISKAQEELDSNELSAAEDLYNQANELKSRNANLITSEYQASVLRQISSKVYERNRAFKYADEFDPENYYIFETEERLKLAVLYAPENESYRAKLNAFYIREEEKVMAKIRSQYESTIRKGDRAYEASEFNKAIQFYEQAINILPNDSLGIRKLRYAKSSLTFKIESKSYLIEQIQIELDNGDKYDERFISDIKAKIENHIKDYPDDADLLVAASAFYIKEKLGLEEAFLLAEKALEIEPENELNFMNLGDLYFASGNLELSMEYLLKALDLPRPKKDHVIQKLTEGYYRLALRSKDKEQEKIAVQYANMGLEMKIDHPVFQRVIKRFCPGLENCK